MISVIVVSFNTREKLRRCLQCIERSHEIIVVDNNSTDGSVEMIKSNFPWVVLVDNDENVGFGMANNQGSQLALGDLHLYLNSDAYAKPGAIDCLASVFEDSNVVAAGGRLLNLDGSLQSCTATELTLWKVFCEQTYLEKLLPKSKWANAYWTTMQNQDKQDPWETEQVMGACLMVRAEKGNPLELFDPRFFLYCEDTDLCKRLRKHGKIIHVPEAEFFHELGSSSQKNPAMGIIRYNWGKELYFRIHCGVLSEYGCFVLNRFGASLRLGAWIIASALRLGRKNNRSQMISSFWNVFTAPYRYPSE
jgi:N-acetylglucosaminyl-diphospho-decaprenol L-rhamnosyltransferase